MKNISENFPDNVSGRHHVTTRDEEIEVIRRLRREGWTTTQIAALLEKSEAWVKARTMKRFLAHVVILPFTISTVMFGLLVLSVVGPCRVMMALLMWQAAVAKGERGASFKSEFMCCYKYSSVRYAIDMIRHPIRN